MIIYENNPNTIRTVQKYFMKRVLREVITHIIYRWAFTGENCVFSKI
jgi:hypothetical protein